MTRPTIDQLKDRVEQLERLLEQERDDRRQAVASRDYWYNVASEQKHECEVERMMRRDVEEMSARQAQRRAAERELVRAATLGASKH
jgi:hypothetical protein